LIQGPKERNLGRRTARPAIGTQIICKDLRMYVQAGMSDDLWAWLMDNGWREIAYFPDRRQYRDLPSSWVTRLVDVLPGERAAVLAAATEHAVRRPRLRNAAAPAAKGKRR
jgi:hypothetical protein